MSRPIRKVRPVQPGAAAGVQPGHVQYYFQQLVRGVLVPIGDKTIANYLNDEIANGRLLEAGMQSTNTALMVLRALNVHEPEHAGNQYGFNSHILSLMKGRIKGAFQRFKRQRLQDEARQRVEAAEAEAHAARETLQEQAINAAVAEAQQNAAKIPQNEVGFQRIADWLTNCENANFMELLYVQYFACQGWRNQQLKQKID